ncbi:MAG: hypothetical protein JWR67_1406 [Mucilaginibacter sp.]|nr:hypothetical protein [Mucilaginibacter sp.]
MEDLKIMKKAIVITSIFQPTQAVKAFAAMSGCQLIVIGDKKTPDNWAHDNVAYFSVDRQEQVGGYLHQVLPYNHYSRKMLGYIYAIKQGVEFIIDTDDDNIPKDDWSFPELNGTFSTITRGKGFINVYELFTDMDIWPRGLPLDLIKHKFNLKNEITMEECKIGIWQGLADEDPDVDAIYRLTNDTPCYFNKREPVVLDKGTISPFNTQNTIIRKELFALMYLPTYVTFRFTDILRGLIAQPIMWLYDYQLGFTDATVVQKRNPHDYFKDFVSEIPMYKHCREVIEITDGAINRNNSICDNLFNAYGALYKQNIVQKQELDVLEAWFKDISPTI